MSYTIKRVVVIGSGTMGGGIAAHAANAGLHVYLLDVAPKELTPEEEKKGLKLDSPAVRNRASPPSSTPTSTSSILAAAPKGSPASSPSSLTPSTPNASRSSTSAATSS